jgi:hypothetical protein
MQTVRDRSKSPLFRNNMKLLSEVVSFHPQIVERKVLELMEQLITLQKSH